MTLSVQTKGCYYQLLQNTYKKIVPRRASFLEGTRHGFFVLTRDTEMIRVKLRRCLVGTQSVACQGRIGLRQVDIIEGGCN
jgi:hypothetical protein